MLDEVTYAHSKKVRLPKESSSVETWTSAAGEAYVLLSGGYSIAVALGDDVDASISSPLDLAENLLTPREASVLSDWRKGRAPPRADWRRLAQPLNASTPVQRARWAELTAALRIVYNEPNITKENCKAWVEKYPEQMTLLNACKKVEIARHDAKGAKAGSKARRDVREIVACRTVISHFGKQKVRSNTELKKMHKELTVKEADLSKKLGRLDSELPRDKEMAVQLFTARESYNNKLAKIRMLRVDEAAKVARQNTEFNTLETLLKLRIAALETRLKRARA